MKKSNGFKIIILVFSSLVSIIGFIYALIMFILPKDKVEVVDTVTFLEVINNYDCRVESVVDDEYKSNNYYVTVEGTCPVMLSYRIFNDEDVAYNYYVDISNDIKKSDSGMTTSADINMFSYNYRFNSISGGKYQAVVMNDNSVLYAGSDASSKDMTINILKDLGYYYEVNLDSLWLFIIPGVSSIIFIGVLVWLIVSNTKKKEI